MIPKAHRLPRPLAKALSRLPSRIEHGRLASVSFTPKEGLSAAKITCVVSKKVAAKASERNLLKRRLRDIASSALKKGLPGGVLFIRAKQAAKTASFSALREDVQAALSRIG